MSDRLQLYAVGSISESASGGEDRFGALYPKVDSAVTSAPLGDEPTPGRVNPTPSGRPPDAQSPHDARNDYWDRFGGDQNEASADEFANLLLPPPSAPLLPPFASWPSELPPQEHAPRPPHNQAQFYPNPDSTASAGDDWDVYAEAARQRPGSGGSQARPWAAGSHPLADLDYAMPRPSIGRSRSDFGVAEPAPFDKMGFPCTTRPFDEHLPYYRRYADEELTGLAHAMDDMILDSARLSGYSDDKPSSFTESPINYQSNSATTGGLPSATWSCQNAGSMSYVAEARLSSSGGRVDQASPTHARPYPFRFGPDPSQAYAAFGHHSAPESLPGYHPTFERPASTGYMEHSSNVPSSGNSQRPSYGHAGSSSAEAEAQQPPAGYPKPLAPNKGLPVVRRGKYVSGAVRRFVFYHGCPLTGEAVIRDSNHNDVFAMSNKLLSAHWRRVLRDAETRVPLLAITSAKLVNSTETMIIDDVFAAPGREPLLRLSPAPRGQGKGKVVLCHAPREKRRNRAKERNRLRKPDPPAPALRVTATADGQMLRVADRHSNHVADIVRNTESLKSLACVRKSYFITIAAGYDAALLCAACVCLNEMFG